MFLTDIAILALVNNAKKYTEKSEKYSLLSQEMQEICRLNVNRFNHHWENPKSSHRELENSAIPNQFLLKNAVISQPHSVQHNEKDLNKK